MQPRTNAEESQIRGGDLGPVGPIPVEVIAGAVALVLRLVPKGWYCSLGWIKD